MKTKINISYSYGSMAISFSKTFDLTPFYDMVVKDNDNEIYLTNNHAVVTVIMHIVADRSFEVFIREKLGMPIGEARKTIESILDRFKDWNREDDTSIEDMVLLMNNERKQFESLGLVARR